eukprot:TRINITY_DN3981_c0_g1_i11.p1 TRINITY_DN3981_c0_g1~~TRINITY_DN3981_c0_g1_i11.p1  ORF type:complete len:116 (-),score=5.51 TRINITY_DN3981_c0_g1_i11:1547-1894(-)
MRPLEGFTDNKAMHPIESQDNIYHGMCPLFLPGLRYSFMYFSGSFVRQPFFYLLSRYSFMYFSGSFVRHPFVYLLSPVSNKNLPFRKEIQLSSEISLLVRNIRTSWFKICELLGL